MKTIQLSIGYNADRFSVQSQAMDAIKGLEDELKSVADNNLVKRAELQDHLRAWRGLLTSC